MCTHTNVPHLPTWILMILILAFVVAVSSIVLTLEFRNRLDYANFILLMVIIPLSVFAFLYRVRMVTLVADQSRIFVFGTMTIGLIIILFVSLSICRAIMGPVLGTAVPTVVMAILWFYLFIRGNQSISKFLSYRTYPYSPPNA